jgi:hypothetical protein
MPDTQLPSCQHPPKFPLRLIYWGEVLEEHQRRFQVCAESSHGRDIPRQEPENKKLRRQTQARSVTTSYRK